MEEWRTIREYPTYAVSSVGRVRNQESGRYMVLRKNQTGAVYVGLTDRGVQHNRSVALLVANEFLDPSALSHFDTPIHLDGDLSNNRVSNLMWRPRWFAIKYHQQFGNGKRGFDRPIREINTGEVFRNSWEAATRYGLLDRELMLAIMNKTYVAPTFQVFELIE